MTKIRSIAIIVALAVVALGIVFLARHREQIIALIEWTRTHGAVGALVFAAIHLTAVVLMLPSWLFAGCAGYVFGPWIGFLLAFTASVSGASVAFLLGRFVLQRWTASLLSNSARFAAVSRAVTNHSLKMVVLLRISAFLPHNIINYALAVTRVTFRNFVIGSVVGLAPLIGFQVYAGSLAHSAADVIRGVRPDLGYWPWVITSLGLCATVSAIVIAARAARREFQRASTEIDPQNSSSVVPP